MHARSGVVLAAAVALAVVGLPKPAAAANLSFNYGPVAGPPGTSITLSGQCDAATGYASLQFPMRSDALQPPLDSKTFSPGPNGQFSVGLSNDIASSQQYPGEDPIDLEIAVSCGDQFQRQPFASTQHATDALPTIFAALGAGACGYAYVAPPDDPSIPCPGHVKGFTSEGGINDTNFYVSGWSGGATIAVGDVNDDGHLDIVAGSGPGTQSAIAVYNPLGQSMVTYNGAYGAFAGGVNVAVGDVTGDGVDDVVTGAGPGGGPHVKVFSRNQQGALVEVGGFYAYAPNFRGGVTVAVADITGNGTAEIITGAGPGGGPHVRVFTASGAPVGGTGFYAYDPNFHGGVNVAGGDLVGDGRAEIVTGAGPGGGPHVRVFEGNGAPIGGGFYAYAPAFAGGVAVAVGQANGEGGNDIVTGPQIDGEPHIRVFLGPDGSFNRGGFYGYSKIPAGTRVAVAP